MKAANGCSRAIQKVAWTLQHLLTAFTTQIIIAHNHPSGNPEPSQADIALTQRLKESLQIVDVRLLDHLVIGGNSSVSFAERNLL